MSKNVEIWSDGGARPNPGPGGWAFVLKFNDIRSEVSGTEPNTTNNRMEIVAAIKALEALTEPCVVTLHTDSTYLRDSIEKGWVNNWKRNNWVMEEGKQRPNRDLWEALLVLTAKHKVTFVKVKAHADNENNNRCDELVGLACNKAANAKGD